MTYCQLATKAVYRYIQKMNTAATSASVKRLERSFPSVPAPALGEAELMIVEAIL